MSNAQGLSEADVKAAWQDYVRTKAPEPRDRLVRYYLEHGLVQRAAKKLARSLPNQVETDELTSAGAFGLLSAMERFDLSRQVKFETFSQQFIRGAMLDYLREVDHLSRGARAQANRLIEATERLRMKLGRPPAEEELRRQLDVSREKLQRMSRHGRHGTSASIEHRGRTSAAGEGTGRAQVDVLAAVHDDGETTDAPLRAAMKRDVKQWVVQGLCRRHRLVILLYYYEGMTMREIGDVLGMSESRVSQLRSLIIQRLRKRLESREDELMVEVA